MTSPEITSLLKKQMKFSEDFLKAVQEEYRQKGEDFTLREVECIVQYVTDMAHIFMRMEREKAEIKAEKILDQRYES